MFKKNTRKRLLAGALATVMMLTMCPTTWALADDEDIALLPANEEIAVPVDDSAPVEVDTTKTPADPTPSETEAKPTENQNTAPAPSDDEANGGTDSTESGNSTNPTNNSEVSENNSQNNDVVSNSPESEISTQALQISLPEYGRKKAKYFVLLPKRGKPDDNRDQNQENYLPSSNDSKKNIVGSDGGVKGLDASTGYKGFVTKAGMQALKQTRDRSITNIEDGVPAEYLDIPDDLGFFTPGNWNSDGTVYNPSINTNTGEDARKALLDTTTFKFNPNNVTIVWYTIKDQSKWEYGRWVEDIHVDGYLKGVPVNVTYYSNYANNGIPGQVDTTFVDHQTSGDSYTIRDIHDDGMFEAPEGYSFGGWYTNQACTDEFEFTDTTTVLMTELNLYAKWVSNPYPYTIEHYKYNPDTKKYVLQETEGDSVVAGTKITATPKNYDGYVLNPHAEGYLASGTVDSTVPALTLKLFYDPDANGDKIPDRCQYKVTEKVVNGKWDATQDAEDIIFYVSTINMETGEKVQPKLAATDIAAVGNTPDAGYQAGYWKDPAPTVGKEITGDVEFTYTYVPVSKYPYAIEHYKYNPTTEKYEIVETDTKKDSAVAGTVITATPKNYDGYVLNPHAEGYLASGTVDSTVPALTLKLFYDPDANGDKIPDRCQYKVTEKVVNGKWDATQDAEDIIFYVSTINMETGEKVQPKLAATDIAAVGNTPDAGYQAGYWKDPAPTVGKEITGDVEFTYTYVPVSKYPYAIEHYKYNPDTKKYAIVEADTEKNSAVAGTVITATPKNYDGYVLNPHAEGYLASGTVVKTEDGTVPALTLKLFYDPDANGNEIPDSWEYRLTFKVVNGSWNDGGNADIVVYVQFKDQKTGEAFKDEAVVVPVTRIPAVGDKPNSGYHAGAWDTSPYDNYKVQKDTVFTYIYAKDSSGGSSGGHHRRPTVTIPDKVPTGLNGNDHYAYIVGYPDKTVRPQNGITRAEVATIFFRLLTDETRDANSTKSNSYSDVAAGAWYNHAVSTLSAMGIVKGDSDGKFNPNAPITRAEFAAIAARFDDKANTTTADFSDIASHWAKNEISAASNNGWINGYPDGTFRPDNKITRAEAMTLVNRVLKRLPETAEDLHDDMIKWSDNSDASQWFYLAVQEATNSHYYKAKENKFEKWSELRDTRDWTELEK